MKLQKGMIINTSYGTGPYEIKKIKSGCTCPEYHRTINGDDTPSETHNHIVVKYLDEKQGSAPGYLNGYRDDGSNVWNDDKIIVKSLNDYQLSLF